MDRVGATNDVLRKLSDLHSLEELLLPNSQRVTDAGLAFLSRLTNLRSVTLGWKATAHSCSDEYE